MNRIRLWRSLLAVLIIVGSIVLSAWIVARSLVRVKSGEEAIASYRREMQLGGDKVSYDHRMRVKMYDLWQKQNKQKATQ